MRFYETKPVVCGHWDAEGDATGVAAGELHLQAGRRSMVSLREAGLLGGCGIGSQSGWAGVGLNNHRGISVFAFGERLACPRLSTLTRVGNGRTVDILKLCLPCLPCRCHGCQARFTLGDDAGAIG